METPIMSLDINNEMDLMLAHRRGMQFARFSGMSLSEQTRFATAVSEISRNCIEYAFHGVVQFSIIKRPENSILQAVIKDEGKGISNLAEILERKATQYKGRGMGIVYAKRLADDFRIVTNSRGTTVYLKKNIPPNAMPVNNLVIQGWLKHLQNEPAISAYEELKMRNVQLVELTEEMKANASMVQLQMEEIRKLNTRLSANNERMKAFTYAISHDLKTPLTSLRLSSEYLVNNDFSDDTVTFKNILSRAVNRLDKTIHSLIEILDVQNQEKHIIRELSFGSLFSEVSEEFEDIIVNADAVISSDFSVGRIQYVEAFLQSLFRNLLSNALKYRDTSRPIRINVSTQKEGDTIQLIFSDTGSGMDLVMINDRLFAPFSRFSNQAEGKGIGLFLVKSMVENNGGGVSVESEIGVGTTFRFSLVPY
jgi:signal transduction histidine kinase